MTLKFLEGFESCRTDSDARSRNILQSTTSALTVSVPSTTGMAGYGLAQLTAANTAHNATPFSGSSQGAIGWWTGLTVNQAWNAGGFSFGVSARSNLGTIQSFGSGSVNNANQICYDGSKYWAISLIGSTYTVWTSTNLQSWTQSPSQPTGTLTSDSTITYLGNGIVAVGIPTATNGQIQYTTNGITWTAQTTITNSNNIFRNIAAQTGNATYPHVLLCSGEWNQSGSGAYQVVVAVGTVGGTLTNVVNTSIVTGTPTGVNTVGTPRALGGSSGVVAVLATYTNTGGTSSFIQMAPTASIQTAANWTQTVINNFSINDIAFNATANVFVIAGTGGIYTIPNGTGTSGVPNPPASATVTPTQRYSTAGMNAVMQIGSLMYAFGQAGHIISSPNGITWTEVGSKVIPVGTAGTDWRTAYYDGAQYVLCSDATSGCIATTSDGTNNYQCQYTSDKAFSAATSTDVNGICIMPVTQTTAPTNPLTNAITSTSGNKFYVVAPSAVSSGSITAYTSLNNWGSTTTNASTNVIATGVTTRQQATHYYELVYTKSTSAVNSFTFQLFVDNVLVYGPTAAQPVAATTDTTSVLFAIIPTTQCVSQVDDVYLNFIDGSGMSGVQGTLNIVAQRPTTDVQAQWVKSGSAASNSLSVATSALSSIAANYVSSSTSGDKDIYTSTTAVPTGYTVRGIQTDVMMTSTTTSTAVVNVGVSSGGTEVDSANVSLTSQNVPTLVSLPLDKNPNGNIAWTNSAVQASQFVLNHVT